MENKVRKTFLLPKELFEALVEYQKKNYLSTMTQAAIQLIQKGLESEKSK